MLTAPNTRGTNEVCFLANVSETHSTPTLEGVFCRTSTHSSPWHPSLYKCTLASTDTRGMHWDPVLMCGTLVGACAASSFFVLHLGSNVTLCVSESLVALSQYRHVPTYMLRYSYFPLSLAAARVRSLRWITRLRCPFVVYALWYRQTTTFASAPFSASLASTPLSAC